MQQPWWCFWPSLPLDVSVFDRCTWRGGGQTRQLRRYLIHSSFYKSKSDITCLGCAFWNFATLSATWWVECRFVRFLLEHVTCWSPHLFVDWMLFSCVSVHVETEIWISRIFSETQRGLIKLTRGWSALAVRTTQSNMITNDFHGTWNLWPPS